MPRFGLAAGADPAAVRDRGALCIRLSHPARGRREVPRRPSGTTGLHRPACVVQAYVPGAGWIGPIDLGLLAGEGHIHSPAPHCPAAPRPWQDDGCRRRSSPSRYVTPSRGSRVANLTPTRNGPRSTRWGAGGPRARRRRRATHGGREPTFISIERRKGRVELPALSHASSSSPRTSCIACAVASLPGDAALRTGPWYPGEALPRWALSCLWRKDGEPLWERRRFSRRDTRGDAKMRALRQSSRLPWAWQANALPAYEDPWIARTGNLPPGVSPATPIPASPWDMCCR